MSDIERFVQDFHRHFTRDPNARVFLGLSDGLGALPDPSLRAAAARLEEARGLLGRLESLRPIVSDFDTLLDLDLAELSLRQEVHDDTYTFNGRSRLEQSPLAGDEIGEGIFLLFVNDPRPAGERLADITARLEQAPDYLAGLLDRLDTPVARWVQMDLEKVAALPELFATLQGWAEREAWADRPRLKEASARAERALRDYASALGRLPRSVALHVGPGTTAEIVRLRGIDKSLAALHEQAREFLAETQAVIGELRGRLVAKYGLDRDTPVEELHRFLNWRYPVERPQGELDDVLGRYRAECEKIRAFITERDLFPLFDEQEIRILRTPRFMEPSIPAGAMMPPPPFRDGTRISLVYLTLSEALLDEHTELTIPSMMIHEGTPGHHLQLATAANHASVIRRHFDTLDHCEGWTTMLEDYMLDLGYMGDLTDEARFCGKRDISRLGARTGIDLFFMSGDRSYLELGVDCDLSSDDAFTAAGSLLHAVTGFTPGRVEAELNWYSQRRGYPLSYLAGNRGVWELKRELAAQGQLAGLALDREFHRLYLQSGNMPLRFLRRVFAQEGLLPAAS